MTIIQPYKNTYKANFLILILVFSLISMTIWGVFLYNQLVNVRHEIKTQGANISRAEVASAELKNALYNVVEAKNLKASLDNQALVLDKNPEYVKSLVVSH
jgi:hypothetical protein